MKLIDTYIHESQGYNPFLINDRWQVAQLNHAPEEELNAIERLDIHFHTEEVFLLIEGIAVLIAANLTKGKIKYDLQIMKPGITYNIPKNMWHNIAMYQGSKVLIVEDAYTHKGDYEFHYLSEEEKQDLRSQVNQLMSKN